MVRWTCVALLLWVSMSFAAPPEDLSKSNVGREVKDFIRIFNDDNERALEKWIARNYSDSVLAMLSAEERVINFRQLKKDLGRIELHSVLAIHPSEVSVLVHTSKDEWVQLDFVHEPQRPYRLHGLRPTPASAPARQRQEVTAQPLRERAAMDSTRHLLDELSRDDAFSGVVLIAQDGHSIFRGACGYADRDRRIRNRVNTRFNLGSIDQAFTRIAIEDLIEKHRLARDDKVGKLLPEYPNKSVRTKVTVQQLLDHRSGVPDFSAKEWNDSLRNSVRSLHDYLPLFADKPLNFEPGLREQNSNGGYVILDLIIEKITGQDYYEYIHDTIFEPLRMRNSGWIEIDEKARNRAIGYTHRVNGGQEQSKELRSNEQSLPARGSSAGGSYSTAEDLLRFVNALESGRLKLSIGSALKIANTSPGANAVIESGLGDGYTVIVLSNVDPPAAENVAARVRGWLARVSRS